MRKQPTKKGLRTPWGEAQTVVKIANGIILCSTASHGGYYLSSEQNEKVPIELRQSTFGGLGLKGWYEEDIDWSIVVFTFPKLFTEDRFHSAITCLQENHTNSWLLVSSKENNP